MKIVRDVVSNVMGIAIILTGIGLIYFSLFVELLGNTLWIRIALFSSAILLICLALFLLIFDITVNQFDEELNDSPLS